MKRGRIRWPLVAYDMLILLALDVLLLVLYRSSEHLRWSAILLHSGISFVCVFLARSRGSVYQQIWRYGGIQSYIRLLIADGAAFFAVLAIEFLLPVTAHVPRLSFARLLSIACMNLLGALSIRMIYRYAFKYGPEDTPRGHFLRLLLRIFSGEDMVHVNVDTVQKIKIAIIGAGRVGVNLAEELLGNADAAYAPRCFVDGDPEKAGREIHGITVVMEDEHTVEQLSRFEVQEVVLAIQNLSEEKKRDLYTRYSSAGYKVKVYDYPVMQTAGQKRHLREFDVEDLLFRKPIHISDEKTSAYYRDKVILITGGGGSIGSELCRQIAKQKPRKLVILDIYENNAYDIQQELIRTYCNQLNLEVVIASVRDEKRLDDVFAAVRPEIVIHAAAHKHVPLMENNPCEAIKNNVFGTFNCANMAEKYGVEKFLLISTDKAVNPTNVMGASKRLCEMVIQCRTDSKTEFAAVRFGNVLGSNGSVIPLFRKQIEKGGPVTLTDKRIIRYFMTIPEAVQLVLETGAMAKNGELFVLDMGKPVKILDLAENMIRMEGYIPYQDIDIVEVGLRPGEKLYEELLIKSANLTKTDNDLIFIEHDQPLTREKMEENLRLLCTAAEKGTPEAVYSAIRATVPTYKTPEEVNETAASAKEMQEAETKAQPEREVCGSAAV